MAMDVVIFRDQTSWVAVATEKAIFAQGDTIDEAQAGFVWALRAESTLEGIFGNNSCPPQDARYAKLFDHGWDVATVTVDGTEVRFRQERCSPGDPGFNEAFARDLAADREHQAEIARDWDCTNADGLDED